MNTACIMASASPLPTDSSAAGGGAGLNLAHFRLHQRALQALAALPPPTEPVGIPNVGNSCFLAAALRPFAAVPALRDALLSAAAGVGAGTAALAASGNPHGSAEMALVGAVAGIVSGRLQQSDVERLLDALGLEGGRTGDACEVAHKLLRVASRATAFASEKHRQALFGTAALLTCSTCGVPSAPCIPAVAVAWDASVDVAKSTGDAVNAPSQWLALTPRECPCGGTLATHAGEHLDPCLPALVFVELRSKATGGAVQQGTTVPATVQLTPTCELDVARQLFGTTARVVLPTQNRDLACVLKRTEQDGPESAHWTCVFRSAAHDRTWWHADDTKLAQVLDGEAGNANTPGSPVLLVYSLREGELPRTSTEGIAGAEVHLGDASVQVQVAGTSAELSCFVVRTREMEWNGAVALRLLPHALGRGCFRSKEKGTRVLCPACLQGFTRASALAQHMGTRRKGGVFCCSSNIQVIVYETSRRGKFHAQEVDRS